MILKIIRIFISFSVILLFIFALLNASVAAIIILNFLTSFQIIPVLLKSILSGISFAFFALAFLIIITIIFGRLYCSFLCPLGILQDIIIFITNRNNKFKYIKDYKALRYSIFFILIFISTLGLMQIINLLDPFSIFTRIITNIIKPIFMYISNLFIFMLNNLKIYLSYNFRINKLDFITFIISLLSFLTMIIFSILKGRLYCNTICPVGTLLGLISKYSLFTITIDHDACTSCRMCEKKCKAGCINSSKKVIDVSRCISCYNCLNVCSVKALKYQVRHEKSNNIDTSKRQFIKKVIPVMIGVGSIISFSARILLANKIKISSEENLPVIPPGAQSISYYSSKCTSCHICVSSCPTKVIEPSFHDFGLSGIMQPKLNYLNSYCDYECNICSRVCPTGAIKPLALTSKKLTQLGQTNLLKNLCIVYAKNQDCGACAERCPTQAVYMIPYKDELYAPVTDINYCIGCGACEFACPTIPKAITIKANIIHKKALKPVVKPVKRNKLNADSKEFPF